jgi:hypothetical protein
MFMNAKPRINYLLLLLYTLFDKTINRPKTHTQAKVWGILHAKKEIK